MKWEHQLAEEKVSEIRSEINLFDQRQMSFMQISYINATDLDTKYKSDRNYS